MRAANLNINTEELLIKAQRVRDTPLAKQALRRTCQRALPTAPSNRRGPLLLQTWDGIDNKPVVVGYSVGLLVGLYFVESLIHLPVLNLVRTLAR